MQEKLKLTAEEQMRVNDLANTVGKDKSPEFKETLIRQLETLVEGVKMGMNYKIATPVSR